MRIVGNYNEGQPIVAVQASQQLDNLRRILGIQIPSRLVAPYYRRPVNQSTGNGDALLFATAKLHGLVKPPLLKPNHLQSTQGFSVGFGLRNTSEEQWKLDVLLCTQHRKKIVSLKDEPHSSSPEPGLLIIGHGRQVNALDSDLALGDVVKPRETVEKRSLATARRAHYGNHLALSDLEVETPKSFNLQLTCLVDLPDRLSFNHRWTVAESQSLQLVRFFLRRI